MWIVVWFPANPIYFGPFEEHQDAVDYAKTIGTGTEPFEVKCIHPPEGVLGSAWLTRSLKKSSTTKP